ncbi:hypothetical protein B0H17DRAFT_1145416 [Mycena rosella]|uniref:Uncharacterized protein n=1 Tax=Mycena rosella TaxID=1033263 RepID=A0AAD7G5N9_MYCRO|nr:hypothetical protein B0H17DRAFT_1145416 [Mycena rosella]
MLDDSPDLLVPTSNPYEDVLIPGFSQRYEAMEEVENEIVRLLEKGAQKLARRAELEAELGAILAAEESFCTLIYSPPEAAHSSLASGGLQKRCIACATCADDRTDDIDVELLRLQCNDLEAERDSALEECQRLRQENVRDRARHKTLVAFARKETGHWRRAAANANTRLESAMRDLGVAIRDTYRVLSNPDSQ